MTLRTLLAAALAAGALATPTAHADPDPPFYIDLSQLFVSVSDEGCIAMKRLPQPVICLPVLRIIHELPPF